MKISKKKLQEIVDKTVQKKLISLKESTDFTAKRRIIHSAQLVSMEFEKEIGKLLDLVNPDEMTDDLQKRYFQIAEAMKSDIIKAVAGAVGKFATLPRQSQQDPKPKA